MAGTEVPFQTHGLAREGVVGVGAHGAVGLKAERGDIEKDHPVPVEVRGDLSETDALRLATVENIQREQLAPMDEAEAFATLLGEGASLEDVAAKAGVSVLTVKRRVALASLSDEAKALVREGEFSLSVAEALTLGTHDQQRAVIALHDRWRHAAIHKQMRKLLDRVDADVSKRPCEELGALRAADSLE